MALKRSFFSRLFGSSSAQEETAEESAEEQRQVLPEEPPPLPDNSFLEIPPDHIINRLVSLRTEQAGSETRTANCCPGQNWTGSWSG